MEKDPLLHRRQTRQRDAAGLLVRGLNSRPRRRRTGASSGKLTGPSRNTPTLQCDIRPVRCGNKATPLE